MGYIRTPTPSYSSRAIRKAYLESPCGGVCYNSNPKLIGDDQSPDMLNMISISGVLRTRFGQSTAFDGFSPEGTFHSITKQPFCSKTILHAGTKLYALSGSDSEPLIISTSLPDASSVFVEFSSKLYIYCSRRIFSVDKAFTAIEEMPYAPVILSNLNPNLPMVTSSTKTDADINLAAPRIAVTFTTTQSRGYKLPYLCDITRPIRVYNKNVLVSDELYTLTEQAVTFATLPNVESANDIKIEYYVKTPSDIGFEDKLTDCKIGISFGGTVVSGTRIFMSGNKNYAGMYFRSALLDPLRFDESDYEIIGNTSENITGMIKQYGKLIIFTERSVSSMSYSFSDGEPIFSVNELNSSIGCDMPRSIELIDNRVVFGNSRNGLFIIAPTENYGEQNIKPISGNINSGHANALLSQSESSLKCAFSLDFARRYYLCVGSMMYVWDYDTCAYTDSSSYAKSQSRLIWYVFNGIDSSCLFELTGQLFSYRSEGGFAYFADTGLDFGEVFTSYYTSKSLDLSYPGYAKNVKELVILSSGRSFNGVVLNIYGDGIEYDKASSSSAATGTAGILDFRLPSRRVSEFKFRLGSSSGVFEICGICVSYTQKSS